MYCVHQVRHLLPASVHVVLLHEISVKRDVLDVVRFKLCVCSDGAASVILSEYLYPVS